MNSSRPTRQRRWPALLYLGLYAAMWLAQVVIVRPRCPGLIKERFRPGPGSRERLPIVIALYGLPRLVHYLIAALDLGYFNWSKPGPLRFQVAGLIGFSVAHLVLIWAMLVNPFFSSAVRMQRDRGHHLVTAGPYQIVRHPGYLAFLSLPLSSGLALGSWWSLLPLVVWIPAVVRRVSLEDQMLCEELEGYAHYAERVRSRLLPGIW